mmetsp:Transcript_1010/g.2937  ORF Transcript_1010/g.2937 Transcript_1010/m.2937 type:complete len:494 (+) Transcript_1010:120-1601(+)
MAFHAALASAEEGDKTGGYRRGTLPTEEGNGKARPVQSRQCHDSRRRGERRLRPSAHVDRLVICPASKLELDLPARALDQVGYLDKRFACHRVVVDRQELVLEPDEAARFHGAPVAVGQVPEPSHDHAVVVGPAEGEAKPLGHIQGHFELVVGKFHELERLSLAKAEVERHLQPIVLSGVRVLARRGPKLWLPHAHRRRLYLHSIQLNGGLGNLLLGHLFLLLAFHDVAESVDRDARLGGTDAGTRLIRNVVRAVVTGLANCGLLPARRGRRNRTGLHLHLVANGRSHACLGAIADAHSRHWDSTFGFLRVQRLDGEGWPCRLLQGRRAFHGQDLRRHPLIAVHERRSKSLDALAHEEHWPEDVAERLTVVRVILHSFQDARAVLLLDIQHACAALARQPHFQDLPEHWHERAHEVGGHDVDVTLVRLLRPIAHGRPGRFSSVCLSGELEPNSISLFVHIHAHNLGPEVPLVSEGFHWRSDRVDHFGRSNKLA